VANWRPRRLRAAAAQEAAEEAAAAQAVIDAEGGCPPGWSFDDTQGCLNPDNAGFR
jgi:hypothetical protein